MNAEEGPETGNAGQDGAPQDRRRRGIFVAVLPLIIFVALAAIFLRQLAGGGASSDIPSALIGKPVPQFTLAALEGLNGKDGAPMPGLSTGDLKGAISVVNVWASWCVPCRVEAPLLEELGQVMRDASICGLGQAAPNAFDSVLKHFPDELA